MSTVSPEGPPDAVGGAQPTWKSLAWRSAWLLLYPLALISIRLMRDHPRFTEQAYAQSLFPGIQNAVSSVFAVFPFSFAEFLLYSLCIALGAVIVVIAVRLIRKTLPVRRLVSWLLWIAIVGGIGLNAFYWMWGFNYYRVPLKETMGLSGDSATTEQLEAVCLALARSANELRQQLGEDENGVFEYEEGNAGILRSVPDAYAALGQDIAELSGTVKAPKPVAASAVLAAAGIAGIYIPFTEEANVNITATPLLIAASAAHEAAHSLGIAREEEANFVSYLACIASDDPQIQYSGTMLALIHAGNALARYDSEAYSRLWNTYDDAVVRDLRANNAYVQSHEGTVSETVDKVNDSYLRANAQEAGVASYGEMVDLLTAYFLQQGLV